MCLCLVCGGVGGVGWEGSGLVSWTWVWRGGVILCLCELLVLILCVDDRSRCMYIVLSGYLHILGAHSVQSC